MPSGAQSNLERPKDYKNPLLGIVLAVIPLVHLAYRYGRFLYF